MFERNCYVVPIGYSVGSYMTKITSTIVGAAGEYHVLSQLLRRGWIAALAPDGAPNMDILVADEDSTRLCAIQVKTRRDIGSDKGWHMKPKHEDMVADDLFDVFTSTGRNSGLRTGKRPRCSLSLQPSIPASDTKESLPFSWKDRSRASRLGKRKTSSASGPLPPVKCSWRIAGFPRRTFWVKWERAIKLPSKL